MYIVTNSVEYNTHLVDRLVGNRRRECDDIIIIGKI